MERPANGDDPGEIETGDVVKRDPWAADSDPGEIELVELREGQHEDPAVTSRVEESEPDDDPGEIKLDEIYGDIGEREVDA